MRITLTEEQLNQLEPIKKEVDKAMRKEKLGVVLGQIILHGEHEGQAEVRLVGNEMAQKLVQTLNPNQKQIKVI